MKWGCRSTYGRDLAGSGLLHRPGEGEMVRPTRTALRFDDLWERGRLRNKEVAKRIGHNVFLARCRAGYSLHRTEIGMIEGGDRDSKCS